MSSNQVKRILVVGATGQQGGAVIKALLANPPPFEHEILALTRKATSKSAQKLASNPNVKIIEGDLDHPSAIFEAAGGQGSVWAAFLVTMPTMKQAQPGVVDKEIVQGTSFVDSAIAAGVEHLVFSSVDRGGNEKSWTNPTYVPHFVTKHEIELHIREKKTENFTYTILRPTAFMDNYQPGFQGRVFAATWAQIGNQKLQIVATSDIGIFAAKALSDPAGDDFKNQAIGLAGDDLTQAEANAAKLNAVGWPMIQSYWIFGYLIKWAIADMGRMFKWFSEEGYGVDIEHARRIHPGLKNFETWLKEESGQ